MKPTNNPFIRFYRNFKIYIKLPDDQAIQFENYQAKRFIRFLQIKLKLAHVRIALWLLLLLVLSLYLPAVGNTTNYNFLHLTRNDSISLLSVIITVLATIFGISIAFIVLSLESSKAIFSWHSIRKTFKNEYLLYLSTIFLGSILFTTIVMMAINYQSFQNVMIISIYVSVYLFFICILVLVPYVRNILDVISDRDEIVKLTNSIKPYHVTFLARKTNTAEYSLDLENNPLIILSEIGVRSIRNHERFAANWVIQSLLNKFISDFNGVKDSITKYDLRDVLSGYAFVFNDIGSESIRTQDVNSLVVVARFVYRVILKLTKENKIEPIYDEMHEIVSGLIAKSLNENFIDGAINLLPYYTNIIVCHWTNSPPSESDLWEFQKQIPKSPDYDISNYWRDISSNLLFRLGEIGRLGLDKREPAFLDSLIMQYYNLSNEILKNDIFGPKQKLLISSLLEFYKRQVIEESIKSGLITSKRTMLHFAYPEDLVESAVVNRDNYDLIILKNMGEVLVMCAKDDRNFSTFELNNLGTIGRILVRQKSNKDCVKALIYIADIFDNLRKVFQSTSDKDIKSAEFYIELHKQINSIYKWQGLSSQKNSRIVDERNTKLKKSYSNSIRKFTKLTKTKKYLNQINRWNSVFK